jgi:1-acyl-sn-glycerol-3-phosphate acyltransferase
MLLFLPGITIPAFFGQRAVAVTFFFMKLWSWIFSKLTFIRYEIIDRHKIPKGEAFIYVSNHTSFLDLPGICMTIRRQFRPLAKKELLKIPVFGLVTRATCVVVDRSSSESRKKSMNYLSKILKMEINILIFPEGTQNRSQEILQPFKEGAFRIAFDTKQRILPLAVVGAGKLMPPGKAKVFPGTIKIVVGDPIAVVGDDQNEIVDLKEKSAEVIKEMILSHTR